MPINLTIYGQQVQKGNAQVLPINQQAARQQVTDSQGLSLTDYSTTTGPLTQWVFDVRASCFARVQVAVTQQTGSGTSSAWSITVSDDGVTFYTPPTGALTFNAPFLSSPIDVSTYAYIALNLTTLSTYSTETVNISVVACDATTGPQGATGANGTTGGTGATGATGSTGATGATGAMGTTGATGAAGAPVSQLVYTSHGTYTPTVPVGATRCLAEVQGAGGGGAINTNTGGGGGGGGYVAHIYTGLTGGSSTITAVVGTAGARGGTSGSHAGNNGGSSTASDGTTTVTGGGGTGGDTSGSTVSGGSGSGSAGDVTITGQSGSGAAYNNQTAILGCGGNPAVLLVTGSSPGSAPNGAGGYGDANDLIQNTCANGADGWIRLTFFP